MVVNVQTSNPRLLYGMYFRVVHQAVQYAKHCLWNDAGCGTVLLSNRRSMMPTVKCRCAASRTGKRGPWIICVHSSAGTDLTTVGANKTHESVHPTRGLTHKRASMPISSRTTAVQTSVR